MNDDQHPFLNIAGDQLPVNSATEAKPGATSDVSVICGPFPAAQARFRITT